MAGKHTPVEYYMSRPNPWRMTSPYGPRKHPITGKQNSFHNGVDFGIPRRLRASETYNAPVPTPYPGLVISAGFIRSRGNTVAINIRNTHQIILFQHLQSCKVKPSQQVNEGEIVGPCGTSGDSTGIHLHLEIRVLAAGAIGGRVWGDPANYRPEDQLIPAKFKTGDRVTTIAGPYQNIRRVPGVKSSIVGQLHPGVEVEIGKDTNNNYFQDGYYWYMVTKDTLRIGWLADRWLVLV